MSVLERHINAQALATALEKAILHTKSIGKPVKPGPPKEPLPSKWPDPIHAEYMLLKHTGKGNLSNRLLRDKARDSAN